MKKIILLLFFIFPSLVYAEDIYLKNLQIKNGELSLPFDKYNTEYTITLDDSTFQVDFNYEVEEGVTVAVNNNQDLENDSMVTLSVIKDKDQLDYHFYILKNSNEVVSSAPVMEPEIKNKFIYENKQYIIPSVCLLLIILCHRLLFHKKKSKIKII